jgi:hypothetical protein
VYLTAVFARNIKFENIDLSITRWIEYIRPNNKQNGQPQVPLNITDAIIILIFLLVGGNSECANAKVMKYIPKVDGRNDVDEMNIPGENIRKIKKLLDIWDCSMALN